MSSLLVALTAWMAVGLALSLLVSRSIRLADERDAVPVQPGAPDFVPAEWTVPTAGSR